MKKELLGHLFNVEIVRDEDAGEPQKHGDGYGVVTGWMQRKLPGYRVLASDRGSYRFYDWNASVEKAVTDSWGISEQERAAFVSANKREPTKREVYARAVQLDFERLAAWFRDEWHYVGVVVTLLKTDSDAPEGYFATKFSHSLWGIESDAGDYLDEVAQQLAQECIDDFIVATPFD